MASAIDFDVTVDDWIAFQQFTDTGTICVATMAPTITAITEEYVSFLRALTFMDCQIEEALYDAIGEIKQRREHDAKDYSDSIKTNETSLSDVDSSTEDQTKESIGADSANDWV